LIHDARTASEHFLERSRPALRIACSACLAVSLAFGAATPAANDALPVVKVPAPNGSHGPLLLVLSGDGDWTAFMRELSETAAAHGAPVLGLKARSYLSTPRKPEDLAASLATAVREQLKEWQRDDIVIVGYSRGADFAPFIVNRWPEDLRARVRAIGLIGLSENASFEFHWEDLAIDVSRPTDIPTRPEIEKLAGLPMLCFRGEDEQKSACDRPVSGMRRIVHDGRHRAKAGDGTTGLVLRELGLAP
jgi:type IV secretory pathway VirJ component